MTAEPHDPPDPRGPFAQVPFAWVRELGADAAVLLALITYRADREPWAASYADLADESGLSQSQVKTALVKLRNAGRVTSQRATSWGSTQAWSPTFPQVTPRGVKTPARKVRKRPAERSQNASPSLETIKTTRPLPANAGEERQAPVLDYAPTEESFPLLTVVPAQPEPAGQEDQQPTGGDLFAAWVDAYTERRGEAPDKAVNGRLAGAIRTVVKSRTDLESWRRAWRAARSCGARGDWRIVEELVGVESRYQPKGTNHYLSNLKAGVHSRPALGSVASAAFAALPAPTDPPTRGIQP